MIGDQYHNQEQQTQDLLHIAKTLEDNDPQKRLLLANSIKTRVYNNDLSLWAKIEARRNRSIFRGAPVPVESVPLPPNGTGSQAQVTPPEIST